MLNKIFKVKQPEIDELNIYRSTERILPEHISDPIQDNFNSMNKKQSKFQFEKFNCHCMVLGDDFFGDPPTIF